MRVAHLLLLPLSLGISILAWRAVVQRGHRLALHLRCLDFWTYWAGFLALALMITLPMSPIQALVSERAGVPGLALYLQEVAALCACWCWGIYLVLIEGSLPHRRELTYGGLAALVVITAAFMGLRFPMAQGRDIARLGPGADAAARYLATQRLLYRGVMLIFVAYGLRHLRRYSAIARSRPALWARLRAITWVLDFMFAYAVYEMLTILVPPVPDLGAYLNRLRAYLMVLVLATPTAWYARWMALLERWTGAKGQLAGLGRWRVHRRLAPLWRALRPVRPSLSLLPAPRRVDLWWPGDLDFRVCSETMEIRDWSIGCAPMSRRRHPALQQRSPPRRACPRRTCRPSATPRSWLRACAPGIAG